MADREDELLIAKGNVVRLFKALGSMTRAQRNDMTWVLGQLDKNGYLPVNWRQQRAQQRGVSVRNIDSIHENGAGRLRRFFKNK